MINKVILVGRLGQAPVMRYANSGTAIANFSVATERGYKNNDGAWQTKTEWVNVVAFGKRADAAGEYLQKGSLVYVDGHLQTRSWEDNEGRKNYRTEVVVDVMKFLADYGKADQPAADQPAPDPAIGDEDIPF